MSPLLTHVQAQQDAAHRLEAVLAALVELRNHRNLAPHVQAELMDVALYMSSQIAMALDSVNLPEGDEA